MSRPLVSVCIANYNGIAVIDDCLDSVLSQIGEVSVEIIVHDDASSDGSVPHIRDRYPHVQVIESNENVGFCIANNRMAEVASGEYLLLLNNDAALHGDALVTLYKAALETGAPAILGLPQYDAETRELLDNGSLLDPFLNPVPNKNLERRDVGMVMGACMWIPKMLWDELDGFPDWFESIGEDLYLCRTARLWGYGVHALGVSGYYHWVGKSFGGGKQSARGLSTTYRRRALSERNKSYVLALTFPTPWLLLIFPLHLFLLFVEGILLSLAKRKSCIWNEIYKPCFQSLWRERNRLLCLRKKLQNNKRTRFLDILNDFTWLPYKLQMLIRHGIPSIS